MDEFLKYGDAVTIIKRAIEQSRYRAAVSSNSEMLSLYYGIGRYVSANTRNGTWGTDAIHNISMQLQKELPGLRGYSETNIKYMRLFYENWCPFVNRQPTADNLEVDGQMLLLKTRQSMADDLNWNEFLSLSFSHHIEIITKTTTIIKTGHQDGTRL